MSTNGGLYIGSDLSDKTFHGFRLDNDTGHLDVEVINDGSVVQMGDPNVVDAKDYKAQFWTSDTIRFSWGENGHLLMEYL